MKIENLSDLKFELQNLADQFDLLVSEIDIPKSQYREVRYNLDNIETAIYELSLQIDHMLEVETMIVEDEE